MLGYTNGLIPSFVRGSIDILCVTGLKVGEEWRFFFLRGGGEGGRGDGGGGGDLSPVLSSLF